MVMMEHVELQAKDYDDFWNESEREIADAAQAYRIEYYQKNFPYIIDGVVQYDDMGRPMVDLSSEDFKDFDDDAFIEESRALFVPKIESNFKAKATNFCNAQGIYQVLWPVKCEGYKKTKKRYQLSQTGNSLQRATTHSIQCI